jgi:hypothetical protein
MAQPLVKEEIHRLVDELPDDATEADLAYILHVRAEIDAGRRSAREEEGVPVNQLRQRYGLPPLEWK